MTTGRIKNFTFFIMAFFAVITLVSCGKYKGFEKDKSGFYYKFYSENQDSLQPKNEDMVLINYAIRTDDSVLGKAVTHLLMDPSFSFYEGDLFTAITTMHIGDSATFIFEADSFARYYMNNHFPFDKKEIFVDVKLMDIWTKEQMDKMEAEYYRKIDLARQSEDSIRQDYITRNNIKAKPTASGLYYQQTKPGKGKKAVTGKLVRVNYTGRLVDGTLFDTSEGREPIVFLLGAGMVIPGWEEGVAMMREGEKGIMIIPSNLAYRDHDGGSIPPFSTLVFDVELVSVEDAPESAQPNP